MLSRGTLILGLAQCLVATSAVRSAARAVDDPFWAEQAHLLRSEINLVALVAWLACLAALVLPRKRDSAPEKASISALRLTTRIVGGVCLVVLTFVYAFSYSPVRHAVMHNSLVKSILISNFHTRDEWLFRKIHPALPAEGRILYFGAGGNTFSDMLVSQGYDVVPLDIVDESIAKTPVVVYDGIKIPESLGTFDAAIISTVLHHIPDQFIDHIMDDLALHAKRIVIFEDVPNHDHESFVRIAMFCVKMNVELFNHPLNFRSAEAWKERFSKYNVVQSWMLGTDNGSQYAVIVLEPQSAA